MKFKIERMEFISREDVRANPDKIFLFGDNLLKTGYGGQARAMRGEPNAVGIPTKKKPSNTPDSFFSDREIETNKAAIHRAFELVESLDEGTVIVIPSAGLGTGLADLPARAPKTLLYLEGRISALGEFV